MRISLADHLIDPESGRVSQYGATIFEYFEKDDARRSVFAANDGGKWVFGQHGTPFGFEKLDAYNARLVRDRFNGSLLLQYLRELNASLDESGESIFGHGPGKLIVKTGRMPADLEEYYD